MKLMNKENLDQHFMINKELLNRIVDYAELKKQDTILEIGSGKGALTKLLIKKAFVYTVELDKQLVLLLKKKFNYSSKIKIIQANVLKVIKKIDFNKIVANIPYSISEPLLKQILIKQPKIVVLTTGKKFIEHLNTNVLFNIIYDFETKELVKKNDFFPQPRVESVVLKFKLKDDKIAIIFQDLLKQYDKKLKNALISYFQDKLSKNQVRKLIKDFDFKEKSILSLGNNQIKELKKIF